MAISSIWTDPTGLSVRGASDAATGSAAIAAGGASLAVGGAAVASTGGVTAELSTEDPGLADVLATPASSGQREPITDP
jgi:hypothetical protein